MNITIILNNGMKFEASGVDFKAKEFTEAVNNPQIVMVNIGNIVVNKHAVVMIMPTEVSPVEQGAV